MSVKGLTKFWQCQAQALLPQDWQSLEAWERRRHFDLGTMSDFELWQEAGKILDVLKYVRRPDPWFEERYKAIKAEQWRRRKEAVSCQR